MRDHVAELRLTRGDLLNRFDEELHTDFIGALVELRDMPDLRAVVLSANGKVFSAGGDFAFMRLVHGDLAMRLRFLDHARHMLATLIDFPVPIVVALHGDAIGLGATVALACDVVVASRTARVFDPHVAVGLVAGDGGCLVWPQAVGIMRAKRYLLTGDPVSAQDAYAMGLVSELVDRPEDALPAAQALAVRIAALPPLAVQGTKRVLNRLMQERAGEVLELSLAQECIAFGSDDLLEALDAAQQRRVGSYLGR
ncbi:MAG: enoyl-CoA hydratase/isomerase family protein [Mycobacterium sp.]|uniref:enoyl-CoA hydratase/isomerase family protein n=1 Tax=Mycobacterium sp. TaxID=1785 RepID=UPI003C4BAB75